MSIYKTYGIYGIQNTANGKIYIGKTTNNFGDRWDHHKALLRGNKHSNKQLQRDWNVFGEARFDFIIIHSFSNENPNECEIDKLEIGEIAQCKARGIAYNIHDGGSTGFYLGKHLSREAKRKIGEKNRMHMIGRKLSAETKRKMSDSQRARYERMSADDWNAFIQSRARGSRNTSWTDEQRAKLVGNKNGATYSIDDVKHIRKLHEVDHLPYTEISNLTGIPRHTVYLIATYRRWKDV